MCKCHVHVVMVVSVRPMLIVIIFVNVNAVLRVSIVKYRSVRTNLFVHQQIEHVSLFFD
jgi:hypothetical protein